ncbi:hypothetical protein [Luteipulveratus flavus]|uniref:Uncharacterized protein n=1 Tax=Luteipulveratus flavus TaxID=3031728 RepID=A0ABT6C6W6_9MICO|nr:hypothetical protein [Luteipulveratus sp. YIM 133296]MDF8264678.1 hypothetical protein [Luteipulveratus sp. YIM 133296]
MSDPLTDPLDHSVEGPDLQAMIGRLLAIPPDFLAGDVEAGPLVNDAVRLAGVRPAGDEAVRARGLGELALPERLALQVGAWMVAGPPLAPLLRTAPGEGRSYDGESVASALLSFAGLADAVPVARWTGEDPERHEEVVRALCRVLGLRPRGETHGVAEDRWVAVGSAARRAALRAAAEEQRKAEELARRLAEKRAQEAAAQYTHV